MAARIKVCRPSPLLLTVELVERGQGREAWTYGFRHFGDVRQDKDQAKVRKSALWERLEPWPGVVYQDKVFFARYEPRKMRGVSRELSPQLDEKHASLGVSFAALRTVLQPACAAVAGGRAYVRRRLPDGRTAVLKLPGRDRAASSRWDVRRRSRKD